MVNNCKCTHVCACMCAYVLMHVYVYGCVYVRLTKIDKSSV